MNSKKLKKNGLRRAVQASAVALVVLLGLVVSPAPILAQGIDGSTVAIASDAGAIQPSLPETTLSTEVILPQAEPEAEATPGNEEQGKATQTSLDKLSSEILNILIPAFVTLIGGLFALLLSWIRKKLQLDVSNKQIYQWSMVAEMAADRAGEWTRNKTKDLTEGKTIPGPEILEVGANWGLEYGKAHGLVDIGREKLEGLIESKLQARRIDFVNSKR